jgi:hypothetical protein
MGRFIMIEMNTEFTDLASENHTIVVRPYAYGQFRIQVCDKRIPDFDGHAIIREMCTYDAFTAVKVVEALKASNDPLEYCRSLEKPYNCEAFGIGRIRLDNTQEDRPET